MKTTLEHRTAIPGKRQERASRRAWLLRVNVLTCTSLAVLASTDHACAAAGQWQAGARLGMAWLDGPELGPSMEAYLRHGLSDSFDLDLQVLTSVHPFQPDSKSAPQVAAVTSSLPWALGVSSGLVYRWDVLRTIPYAGVSLGVYEWHGVDAALSGAQFGASGRLGVDYLLTRDVVLSVQTSAHCVLADSDVRLPWLQLALGAGYVWGW